MKGPQLVELQLPSPVVGAEQRRKVAQALGALINEGQRFEPYFINGHDEVWKIDIGNDWYIKFNDSDLKQATLGYRYEGYRAQAAVVAAQANVIFKALLS